MRRLDGVLSNPHRPTLFQAADVQEAVEATVGIHHDNIVAPIIVEVGKRIVAGSCTGEDLVHFMPDKVAAIGRLSEVEYCVQFTI